MPLLVVGRTAVDTLAYIPLHRGLEIRRINGHHLDRAPRLRRHEDNGRRSSVGREGQTVDEVFVSHHPIVRRRQQTIHTLQVVSSFSGTVR
jgi:hypothetical protein